MERAGCMGKYRASDIFKHAMEIENAGHKLYAGLSEMMDDPKIKKIFQVMAEQEIKHYDTYNSLMANASLAGENHPSADEGFDGVKYDLLQDRIFNRLEVVRHVAKLSTLGDVLNYMIDIEIDAVDLFENLRHLLNKADHAQINKIINEERSHVKQLVDLRKQYKSVMLKS
jgi:rubrerythrin